MHPTVVRQLELEEEPPAGERLHELAGLLHLVHRRGRRRGQRQQVIAPRLGDDHIHEDHGPADYPARELCEERKQSSAKHEGAPRETEPRRRRSADHESGRGGAGTPIARAKKEATAPRSTEPSRRRSAYRTSGGDTGSAKHGAKQAPERLAEEQGGARAPFAVQSSSQNG